MRCFFERETYDFGLRGADSSTLRGRFGGYDASQSSTGVTDSMHSLSFLRRPPCYLISPLSCCWNAKAAENGSQTAEMATAARFLDHSCMCWTQTSSTRLSRAWDEYRTSLRRTASAKMTFLRASRRNLGRSAVRTKFGQISRGCSRSGRKLG